MKKLKKSLGQHFLRDDAIISEIIKVSLPLHNVLEIGPGDGALTKKIVQHSPKKFIVVEKDDVCINNLNKIININVIHEDARKIKPQDLFNGEPFKIISNLPYNVGTFLFLQWIENTKHIDSMTLMFQKEVADRICAQPHNTNYGRLSVLAQTFATCDHLFDVPPEAFTPPPKVMSSVISVIPVKDADNNLRNPLSIITQHAFQQRRKMVRSSLKNFFSEHELNHLGIKPTQRSENITVNEYKRLACYLNNRPLL